jgi:hypothetical protein
VKGKVAYRAALWTAPVAWGRLPLVGNVRLEILSERVVRTGWAAENGAADCGDGDGEEKLVVRWRTEGNNGQSSSTNPVSPSSASTATNHTNSGLSAILGGSQPLLSKSPDTFSGLFIFAFDSEGKIVSHTIEHADEGNGWDRTAKVVSLTDWLLGKAKGKKEAEWVPVPGLACDWEGVGKERRFLV